MIDGRDDGMGLEATAGFFSDCLAKLSLAGPGLRRAPAVHFRAENGHSPSINFQPFRILADLAATCFSARHQGKASLRMTCCEQKFNIINHYSHE